MKRTKKHYPDPAIEVKHDETVGNVKKHNGHDRKNASKLAKELFVANVSHEIRTPLTGIVGLTEVLLKTSLNAEQQECLEAIQTAGSALMAILNDILDNAKIDAGKMTIEKIPFDLNKVIHAVYELYLPKANAKHIKLQYDSNPQIPAMLMGDPVRVTQILSNLVSNAVKFTNKGTVSIKTELVNPANKKVNVRFKIDDTGIGIPQRVRKNLFHPFDQLDNGISRKYGGTGLGLVITKKLTQLLHGNIEVQSKYRKGSTFIVELPFEKDSSENKRLVKHHNIGAPLLKGANILVVEDHPVNRLLVEKVISDAKGIPHLVSDGKQAISLLAEKNDFFDIILMDMKMPVMNGCEASKYIREQLKLEVPILAFTAAVDKKELKECFESGMNDFIMKPFHADELLRKLGRLLNESKKQIVEAVSAKEVINEHETALQLNYLEYAGKSDKEFIDKLTRVFLSQTVSDMADMRKCLSKQDWNGVHFMAHKMKATCALGGMEKLERLMKRIDLYAKQKIHLLALPEMVKRALDELDQVVNIMKDKQKGIHYEFH